MSKEWYPIIDYELCTSCGVCYYFCPHGVYESNEEGSPLVYSQKNVFKAVMAVKISAFPEQFPIMEICPVKKPAVCTA